MGNLTRLTLCALAASTAFATEADKLCADAKTQTEDNDVATLNDEGPRWYGPVVKGNTTRLENSMKGCCKTKPFTVKMDKLASKWKGAVSGDIECFWRCDLAEEWPEKNEERKDLINESYDCFMMKSPWEVEFASKPKFLPPEMVMPPPPGGELDNDTLERAGLPPNEEKDDDEEDKKSAKEGNKVDDGEEKDDASDEEGKEAEKENNASGEKKASQKDNDGDEEKEEKKDDDSGALINTPNMAAAAAILVAGFAML